MSAYVRPIRTLALMIMRPCTISHKKLAAPWKPARHNLSYVGV